MSYKEDVSFKPTAIARRAGTTNTFYVVGWADRTGRVIVESWTFGAFTLAAAMPTQGGPAVTVFTKPPVTRFLEWISDTNALPPIWDAGCETYGNKLLLLASGTPTRIWTLDLGSRVISILYSSDTNAALAGHRMMSIGKHPVAGFAIFTEQRKPWDHLETVTSPGMYFLMRDTDSNGSIDAVSAEPTETFYYHYPPPWDLKYAEP